MARTARKKTTKSASTRGRPKGRGVSPEMRTGLKIRMSNYTSFPKAIQDRFIDGYEEAKSAYASGLLPSLPDMDDADEVSGWRAYAKQAVFNQVRESGTERDQLYLSEPNKKGEAFRKGIRAGVQVILTEETSGRSAYGARYNPKRRRRNSISSEVYAQARRGGLKDKQIRKLAKYAQGQEKGAYPEKMRQLKQDRDGNAYWPVRTVHNTHWHYTIKEFKPGYVVEFRRRDGQSNRHYITPDNTQSPKKTYYRTKTEAFKALALHAYRGSYAKFKNPRRRR